MMAIVGMVVVSMAVIGGYLMEHGNLSLLVQPAELVIIGGAALGSFLIASPRTLISGTMKKITNVFTAKETSKQAYMDILLLMFECLMVSRREGLMALEDHVNKPHDSKIFTKYPSVEHNHELLSFLCDNLKVYISGNIEAYEFENLMELDIETHEEEGLGPPTAVSKTADALPGLGIVAAVMGVVLTMGKIKEPPEVLGHSVGAALVGTFLGVLLCYGFVGPMGTNLEHQAKANDTLLKVGKAALVGLAKGLQPVLAVEFARRAIPGHSRPTYEELEDALKLIRKK